MSNKIVIPYDFTDAGNAAVKFGVAVARRLEGELLLLHITPEIPGSQSSKDALHTHPMYKAVSANLAEVAKAVQDEHEIETFYKIEEGNLFESIAEVSKAVNAVLIVLATHGVRGIQHFVGSYAGKVINSTEIPVLVIQEESEFKGLNNIVAPLHDDEDFENIAHWTTTFASRFSAVVHIIHSKVFQADDTLRKFTMDSFRDLLNANKIGFVEYNEEKTSTGFEATVGAICKSIDADLVVIEANKDEGKHKIGKEAQQFITNHEHIPVLVLDPEFPTKLMKAQIELRMKYW